MSQPDDESLEAKLRALAEEISASLERAAEDLGLNDIVDRLGLSGDRAKEFADLAGQWLKGPMAASAADEPDQAEALDGARRVGPHPLDTPTEEQGLALSALDSGRWKVDPGTEELTPVGPGPGPSQPIGLVGELRARDWITAGGEVTLIGHDALRRWLTRDG